MYNSDQSFLPGGDARSLTRHLGGRWQGSYGTAPCPVCQVERRLDQTALTLSNGRNGRLLLHCKKSECPFRRVLEAAGLPRTSSDNSNGAAFESSNKQVKRERARAHLAVKLWREARPVEGTLAARYLRQRGITCSLPRTLRFHPACMHGASKRRMPALIALLQGGNGPSVHRTWLSPEGSKAEVQPSKAMLGPVGGGAVRLAQGGENIVVAEGIETALSLASGLVEGSATIWAALSTSGMRRLRLPREPRELTVAADGDAAGLAAAEQLARRARSFGWRVNLMSAPRGMDWNDVLQGEEVAG